MFQRILDVYDRACCSNNPIGTRPDYFLMGAPSNSTCKQRCIWYRHSIWLPALSLGLVTSLVGGGFCISQKPHLLIPGVAMSLGGMALFVGAILFAGITESVAPNLPPPMTLEQIAAMTVATSLTPANSPVVLEEEADSFYALRMDDDIEDNEQHDFTCVRFFYLRCDDDGFDMVRLINAAPSAACTNDAITARR